MNDTINEIAISLIVQVTCLVVQKTGGDQGLIGVLPSSGAATGFIRSRGNLADISSACKAPAAVAPKRRYGAPRRRKGWRSPRRFAYFRNHRVAHSVLECPPSAVLLRPSSAVALLRRMERTGGGPPPLFPEAYPTVPMLTGTAIDPRAETQDPKSMLRQAAGSAEGDDVNEEGDDERPRFARHQQQNSEAQNQGNHQINQSCQCQFH
jgi:hypothetical protein